MAATASVGWAPTDSQYCARSLLTSMKEGSSFGWYLPIVSIDRPSRLVPAAELDHTRGPPPADGDDRRHPEQLGVRELAPRRDLRPVVVEHGQPGADQFGGQRLGGLEDRGVLAGGDDVHVGGGDLARPAQ